MLDAVRTWIMGIAGAAIICAIACELTPKGQVKKVQAIICSIVMAIAVVSPLVSFNFESYSINIAKYKAQAQEIAADGEEISNRYQRTIIEESSAAYILDKAESLSLDIKNATVTVQWSSDGVWYPTEAEIEGAYNRELSAYIESELGIKEEMQHWNGNEDG